METRRRRGWLAPLIVGLALLGLAACGDSPSAPTTSESGRVTPSAGQAESAGATPGAIRVTGRVHAPAGVPTAGANVYITDHGQGRVFASTTTRADGTYATEIRDLPSGVDRLYAVVEISGYATVTAEPEEPFRGTEVTLDVDLHRFLSHTPRRGKGPAPRLDARVLDSQGRPVAGLPVIVTSVGSMSGMIPADWPEIHSRGPDWGCSGRAVTDADGRFTILGLQFLYGGVAYSGSPDWFLVHDIANETLIQGGANPGGVTLTARPSTRLTLSVPGDGQGAVPEFKVHVQVPGDAPMHAWDRSGTRMDVTMPISESGTVHPTQVAVQAPGFRTTVFSLDPSSVSRHVTREVRLARLTSEETARLRIVFEGPGAERARMQAEVVLREPGTELPLYVFDLGGVRYEPDLQMKETVIDFPRGSWDCEVFPLFSRASLRRRVRVEASAGDPEPLVWNVPELQSVDLRPRGPYHVTIRDTVTLARAGEATIRFQATDTPYVPLGAWDVQLIDPEGKVRGSGTVRVKAGPEGGLILLDVR